MGQDDAFSAPEAFHRSAPMFPMWMLLVLVALVGLWLLFQMVVAPGNRANRRIVIYEAIRDKAHKAANGQVEQAAALVLGLREEIRAQVGHLIASGEMCSIVTGVENVLAKPPKLEPAGPVVIAGGAKPQFTRMVTIQEGPAPDAPASSEPAKPASPPSANQQLHDLAKKFKTYWDDRPARLRDLEDAQKRLGV